MESSLVPKEDLVPEPVKRAVKKAAETAKKYLGTGAAAVLEDMAAEAKKPLIYDVVYPKKRPEWEGSVGRPSTRQWEGSTGVMPQGTGGGMETKSPYGMVPSAEGVDMEPSVEVTETTGEDGTKKTSTKVKMAPSKAKGKEGEKSSMYTALSNALQPGQPARLGFSASDINVVPPQDLAAMNEAAMRQYAPFLPRGQYKQPWHNMLGVVATALTQTAAEKDAYYKSLEAHQALNYQQKMLQEQQKSAKMRLQLAEEETLMRLQRYQRQQEAASQLAMMVQQGGPEIFNDPEQNMVAGVLMELAGGSAAAMRPPQPKQYRPHKASQYDLFRAAYTRKHPEADEAGVTAAFAQAKRSKGKRETELRDILFPKDPIAKIKAIDQASAFLAAITSDPAYVQRLVNEGVDLQSVLDDIQLTYGEEFKRRQERSR